MTRLIIKTLEKLVNNIEAAEIDIFVWLGTFLGIIISRIFIESWISGMQEPIKWISLYDFFNSFLIIALILLFTLRKFLKVGYSKIANVLIWGYLLILFPPIIDRLMPGGESFRNFYIFDGFLGLLKRFITFFGDRPDFGITYGTRTQIFLASIILLIYAYLKTKKIIKSILVSISVYSILFFFGTFPSWVAILVKGFSRGLFNVSEVDVAQMFLSPLSLFSRRISGVTNTLVVKVSLNYVLILSAILLLGLFLYHKGKFNAFLKNIRIPQIIFHCGLFLVGIGAGSIYNDRFYPLNYFNVLGFLILLEAIILSWLASVIVNDIADEKIDKISNNTRPLVSGIFSLKEYKILGWFLFGFAVYISSLVNPKVSVLLIIYQVFAYFYSAWPFRLKRFAFFSTLVSAITLLMILFSGYILISPDQSIKGLPFPLIALLVIGYTFSLPIKDFKDIEGDKKNGVYTVPVIFGEYWGKIIIGVGIFFSFLLSVIVFNEPRLFWWALICAATSFWIVLSSGENKKISYKSLFWWILGVIIIYGFILVKIVFF